jgi:hypothetical protein
MPASFLLHRSEGTGGQTRFNATPDPGLLPARGEGEGVQLATGFEIGRGWAGGV